MEDTHQGDSADVDAIVRTPNLDRLADFLKRTNRLPDLIPQTDDLLVILDHRVQPRDVGPVQNVTP